MRLRKTVITLLSSIVFNGNIAVAGDLLLSYNIKKALCDKTPTERCKAEVRQLYMTLFEVNGVLLPDNANITKLKELEHLVKNGLYLTVGGDVISIPVEHEKPMTRYNESEEKVDITVYPEPKPHEIKPVMIEISR